jgi:hypothetical protein
MAVRSRLAGACLAVGLASVSAAAQEQRPLLPMPVVGVCSSADQPTLPNRWRAAFLMAPFTSGQLVVSDITYDASLPAMRVKLYGARAGTLDLLIAGNNSYLLGPEDEPAACRSLGDTGWRPLPQNWLTPQSTCVGSAQIGATMADWWKTPVQPKPTGYWIWSKVSDRTPFRLIFQSAGNQLAPLSHYAMSYQTRFERLEQSDLAQLAQSCNGSLPATAGTGADALRALIDGMEHAGKRDGDELARVMPELAACPVAPFSRWPERMAAVGFLTPFDVDQNPAPTEVLYDWTISGQRSRIFFPPGGPVSARDALLLGSRGYNVTYSRTAGPLCTGTLPGTIRPDWQQRAPCSCEATIVGTTALSPHGTTRIMSCPLASPRRAWAWYTLDGRPETFMVTSLPGDEGFGLFAVLDYREWLPGHRSSPQVFERPAQCTAPSMRTGTAPEGSRQSARPSPAPGMAPGDRVDGAGCSTCHAGPTSQ